MTCTATLSRWEPTAKWESRYREVRDAAARSFAEKGYLGAGTKDIADRLGIRAASLYYYLPSKEAALAAVCEHGITSFIENLRDIICAPNGQARESPLPAFFAQQGETRLNVPCAG